MRRQRAKSWAQSVRAANAPIDIISSFRRPRPKSQLVKPCINGLYISQCFLDKQFVAPVVYSRDSTKTQDYFGKVTGMVARTRTDRNILPKVTVTNSNQSKKTLVTPRKAQKRQQQAHAYTGTNTNYSKQSVLERGGGAPRDRNVVTNRTKIGSQIYTQSNNNNNNGSNEATAGSEKLKLEKSIYDKAINSLQTQYHKEIKSITKQYNKLSKEFATYRKANEKIHAMFIEEVRLNSLTRFAQDKAFDLLQSQVYGGPDSNSRHQVVLLQKRQSFIYKIVHGTVDETVGAATIAGNVHNSYIPQNLLELMNLQNKYVKLEEESKEKGTQIYSLRQEIEIAETLIKQMQRDKDFVEIKYSKQQAKTGEIENQLRQLQGYVSGIKETYLRYIYHLKVDHHAYKTRLIADFSLEIKTKDALIKQLQVKEQNSKDLLRKLIKMIEHPRLVIMANKLLHAEKDMGLDAYVTQPTNSNTYTIDPPSEEKEDLDGSNGHVKIHGKKFKSECSKSPYARDATEGKSKEELAHVFSPALGKIMTDCVEKQADVFGKSRSRAFNSSQLKHFKTTTLSSLENKLGQPLTTTQIWQKGCIHNNKLTELTYKLQDLRSRQDGPFTSTLAMDTMGIYPKRPCCSQSLKGSRLNHSAMGNSSKSSISNKSLQHQVKYLYMRVGKVPTYYRNIKTAYTPYGLSTPSPANLLIDNSKTSVPLLSKKPSRTNVHIRLMANYKRQQMHLKHQDKYQSLGQAQKQTYATEPARPVDDTTTTTEDSFADFAANSFKNSMIVQATQDFNNRNKSNANADQTQPDPYLQRGSSRQFLQEKSQNNYVFIKTLTSENMNLANSLGRGASTQKIQVNELSYPNAHMSIESLRNYNEDLQNMSITEMQLRSNDQIIMSSSMQYFTEKQPKLPLNAKNLLVPTSK